MSRLLWCIAAAARCTMLRRAAWLVATLLIAGAWGVAVAQNVQMSGTTFASEQYTQTVTLTVNTDDIVIQNLTATSGRGNAEYYITDYGTCAVGAYISAGTTCTFTLAFNPLSAGYAQSPAPIGHWGQLYLEYTDQLYGGNVYVDFPVTGSGNVPMPVISPGIISDLIGNDTTGNVGFAGDNGPASGALFAQPSAIAMDDNSFNSPYGNIYIADTGNAVVRVIYQSGSVPTLNNPVQGNIYTIAGVAPTGSVAQPGPGQDVVIATQSHLSNPTGVATDPLGNVYIADSGNNAIRMIKAYSAGYIFTVAGTLNAPGGFAGDGGPATSANLFTPSGVSVDGYGNIYIADNGNNAIRVVYEGGTPLANLIATEFPGTTATVGYIYTVAGGPTNVLQTQFGDGQLATLANLNGPKAVTVDSSGNIYIADYGNFAVRRVDAVTGLISSIATSYEIGMDNPTSLSVDASDDIYFTGQNTCTVYQYNPSIQTGLTTPYVSVVAGGAGSCFASGDGGSATSAGLNGALGVVVGGQGNLYLLENDGVRLVSGQQSSFNYGTVNISNGGSLTAIVTDENILPPPGSPAVVDYSNTLFAVVYEDPQNFAIAPFSGANPNILDCDALLFPTSLSPGTSCGAQIAFQPATDGGPFSGSAYSYGLNTYPTTLTGSAVGSLTTATLNGPSVPFVAEVNQGPSTPQVFILTNTGSSTLHVSNISTGAISIGSFSISSNCPASNTEYVLAAGAYCQITVAFSALSQGNAMTTLQVTDNASTGGGVQTFPIAANATAPLGAFINPMTAAVITSFTFPVTIPGSSSAQTFTFTNMGTAPLNIYPAGWSITGTNAGSFFIASNSCATTTVLAVGAACYLAINFTPSAFTYGAYTANLVAEDDSGGLAPVGGVPSYLFQTLPLTGPTGNPPVQTSSFTLQNGTFPADPIGTPITQTALLVLNDASNVLAITAATGSEFTVGTYAACAGPAGTTCAVPITFTPVGLGTRSGSLIVANLENGVAVPYFFPLTGIGTGTIAALTPGIISTVVGGNGYQTNAAAVGLDGPAAQAQIGPGNSFVMDSAGDMFLTAGNQQIFKVDTSKNIHLYAGTGAQNGMAGDGGPALNASLAYTGPIALDARGGLYLGDSDATQFDDPRRIRYIDPSTGLINTVVGYVPTFPWFPNLAYQSGMQVQMNVGGVLYLFRAEPGGTSAGTEPNWPAIVGRTVQDGSVTWENEGVYTATNGCPAQLDMLGDGCPAQDVLIGIVTGLVVDPKGNLYFAESGLQFDITQNMYANQPATTEVLVPHSMIRRMDANTGIVTVVAGTGDESTYTMGYNVSSVGIPGYTGDSGLATQAEVNASGIAFDSKGNLYFIQDGRYVRKIDISTGNISTVTGAPGTLSATNYQCAPVSPEGGSALTAQYTLLSSITFDAADNMYLADSNACVVRRIDAGTQTVYTVAGAPNAGVPYINFGYGDLGQFNSDGSALEAQLSIPNGVQIDGLANIYIASGYNGGVRKVDVSQSVLPFAGPFGQATYTQQPFTVSAPLTATVLNAGNSGTLQFNSPFISPSWGINQNYFIRDITDPTGAPDCYDLESIASGFECPINVDFFPQTSSPNFVYAQDTVNDNAPNSPQVIQLSGIGFGPTPGITLTPKVVSVFTPQAGVSSPQPITVTNNTPNPVAVYGVNITGSGAGSFSQTNNCNTLAASASCTIQVVFSPANAGGGTGPDNQKATVGVSESVDSAPQVAQLVGIGTTPSTTGPLYINETINVSEGTPTFSASQLLPINETINVSEGTPTFALSQLLPINETINVSEGTPTFVLSQLLPINETINVSEGTPTFALSQLLPINETINVSEGTPAFALSPLLPINETITVSDSQITPVALIPTTTGLRYTTSNGESLFTVFVGPSEPTGTVTLYDGTSVIASGPLSSGRYMYTTNSITPGLHQFQAVYGGSSIYAPSTSNSLQENVQATLTVIAMNTQRNFKTANPAFTFQVSGFVNGDTSVVLSGAPDLSTLATLKSPAGDYPISIAQGTLSAPSYYSFNFVPGTLTVIGSSAQQITFLPFPVEISIANTTLTLAAHSSSALPVTYQVTGPAVLNRNGSSLTLTGTGVVSITASQPGNATFGVATSVTRSFEVTP